MSASGDKMQDISAIPDFLCRNLEYFFTDIDDTITTNGQMPSETLEAVWKLSEAGIRVILVTGRPAGWCDYFVRMWPIAGIIGENGAFYFAYNRDRKVMTRKYLQTEEQRESGKAGLEIIRKRVLAEVPGCGISADQPFRIADLAVDFCEDVPPLGRESIDKICRIMEEEGARYKVSSIHVNCWFGDYDKLTCFDQFLCDFTGKQINEMQDTIVYAGDSPNDEPMFKRLKYTIGVANIIEFLPTLQYFPRYITKEKSGRGFAEMSAIILSRRPR